MKAMLTKISETLQKGDLASVVALVKQGVDEGLTAAEILDGLLQGMSVIGEKFKNNEVFIPEVLVAARAMNEGLNVIKPLLEDDGVEPVGKVIIGTVKGDLHDIGKNIVKMMLVGAGFEVVDLGVDVTEEKFLDAVKEHKPDVLAMSALLTTTMPNMEKVIKALDEKGLRDQVKVMIGGAPLTEEFANKIGADAYTNDAVSAAKVAKEYALSC